MELRQRKLTRRLSPHRAVNTLRLGYENKSVNALEGNNPCLFGDPYKTERHCMCRRQKLLIPNLLVHIVNSEMCHTRCVYKLIGGGVKSITQQVYLMMFIRG